MFIWRVSFYTRSHKLPASKTNLIFNKVALVYFWLSIKVVCTHFTGVLKVTETQTKETIPGLMKTPSAQPTTPGQTPQIPGLSVPAADATQMAQFAQTQLRGQTPLPGLQQQPSPLVPPPLPPSPFGSNPPLGQNPMMPQPPVALDNNAGILKVKIKWKSRGLSFFKVIVFSRSTQENLSLSSFAA